MKIDEQAQQAARHWKGQQLSLIRNRENAVYNMTLPNGELAALRLHRVGYQSDSAIRSELWWCTALANRGLSVPRPLPAEDGEVLVHLNNGRAISTVQWMPGAPLGEAGVPLKGDIQEQTQTHFSLGRLLAQIHNVTDEMPLPSEFARPRWDVDGLTGEAPFWDRFWEHPALDRQEAKLLAGVRDHLRLALYQHAESAPLGLIHADVLRENVLVSNGSLSLIDFDDSGFGFRHFDLGTVLSQNIYEPHYKDIRLALIAGYQAERPVDVGVVDLFTLARICASVGWTISRLSPNDPIHRSHIKRAVEFSAAVFP